MTDSPLQSQTAGAALVRQIPPQAIGEICVIVADSVRRRMEIRDISKARRREVEDKIQLLEAKGADDLSRIELLAAFLDSNTEFLAPADRSKIVDTVCELARGGH